MNARTSRARHRAARRPLTPLADIAQTITSSTAGRRAAVVATGAGLLASTFGGATAAQAAPAQPEAAKLSTVDLAALTEQARHALEAAPVVTVAPEAQVAVEQAAAAVTPAPKPEPKPAPKPAVAAKSTTGTERAATVSRSTERAAAPASVSGSDVVSIASRYVGTKYVVGGASPAGFDCSGLVKYVYAQVGVSLPHQSKAIRYASNVSVVSRAEAQPGDLIYSPGHISIYAGGNMQIDASRPDGWDTRFRKIWQSSPVFLRVHR